MRSLTERSGACLRQHAFRQRACRPARSRIAVNPAASIVARWCLDIRYGAKLEAVALLQEWVRDIGSQAGCTASNTRIHSGAVGTPESRLELEVEWPSLAELEQFWASIPPADHQAWAKRLQQVIVHGSPTWELYRSVALDAPLSATPARPAAAASPGGNSSSSSSAVSAASLLQFASESEVARYSEGAAPPEPPSTSQQTASGLLIASSDEEVEQILDWKGDPMEVRPGDKLPFTFK